MNITYTISKKEMNRRIKAYTALVVSFFISSLLFSLDYVIRYFNVLGYVIIIIILLLLISEAIVVKYFKSLAKLKVELTVDYIMKNKVRYLIKDIKKITVKNTTEGNVREIKVNFINHTNTYISNSVERVDDFSTKLQSILPKGVIKKVIKEPLNYDHPLFYFFLGIIFGFASVELIKILIVLDLKYMEAARYGTAFLTFIMSIYFITFRPIYKRSEEEKSSADYIWGILFIIGVIIILVLK